MRGHELTKCEIDEEKFQHSYPEYFGFIFAQWEGKKTWRTFLFMSTDETFNVLTDRVIQPITTGHIWLQMTSLVLVARIFRFMLVQWEEVEIWWQSLIMSIIASLKMKVT